MCSVGHRGEHVVRGAVPEGYARVNGLEPYAYLRHLFEELPKASAAEALEALLPWNVKPVLRAHSAAVDTCTPAFDKQTPASAIDTKMLA